jgi:hypothetical protein
VLEEGFELQVQRFGRVVFHGAQGSPESRRFRAGCYLLRALALWARPSSQRGSKTVKK